MCTCGFEKRRQSNADRVDEAHGHIPWVERNEDTQSPHTPPLHPGPVVQTGPVLMSGEQTQPKQKGEGNPMTHSSFFLRRYAASVAVMSRVPESANSATSHVKPLRYNAGKMKAAPRNQVAEKSDLK